MDHSRVTIRQSTMSCGVLEMCDLKDDINGILFQLASRLYHPARGQPSAFVVWSDTVDSKVTTDLVVLIESIGLGKFSYSHTAENPKTGNFITVNIFTPDHEKFKAWYGEERIRKIRNQTNN